MEVGKDIEPSVDGLGDVSLIVVTAGPPEGLALRHLQTTGINPALGEKTDVLNGEVGASDPDEIHLSKDASRSGEVDSGTAKNVGHAAEWRLY
jgi:hypothetical protein